MHPDFLQVYSSGESGYKFATCFNPAVSPSWGYTFPYSPELGPVIDSRCTNAPV